MPWRQFISKRSYAKEQQMLVVWDRNGRANHISDGLVSFFNGISTSVGYLLPKPPFSKNSSGTI